MIETGLGLKNESCFLCNKKFEMKGVRLTFSSCEVRLMDERARKNAEMAPFNSNYGAGSGVVT